MVRVPVMGAPKLTKHQKAEHHKVLRYMRLASSSIAYFNLKIQTTNCSSASMPILTDVFSALSKQDGGSDSITAFLLLSLQLILQCDAHESASSVRCFTEDSVRELSNLVGLLSKLARFANEYLQSPGFEARDVIRSHSAQFGDEEVGFHVETISQAVTTTLAEFKHGTVYDVFLLLLSVNLPSFPSVRGNAAVNPSGHGLVATRRIAKMDVVTFFGVDLVASKSNIENGVCGVRAHIHNVEWRADAHCLHTSLTIGDDDVEMVALVSHELPSREHALADLLDLPGSGMLHAQIYNADAFCKLNVATTLLCSGSVQCVFAIRDIEVGEQLLVYNDELAKSAATK